MGCKPISAHVLENDLWEINIYIFNPSKFI
jgi:hypothetical protein